ncbi:hypothetical protein L7F22_052105 [Adiantum nelumboides]|nr:hypothetical protein [Adiantum nelumboides]
MDSHSCFAASRSSQPAGGVQAEGGVALVGWTGGSASKSRPITPPLAALQSSHSARSSSPPALTTPFMHRIRLLANSCSPSLHPLLIAVHLYHALCSRDDEGPADPPQGGLDVLAMHDIAVPKPKEDELLVKVEYAGVNYIDTYQRSDGLPPGAHVIGTTSTAEKAQLAKENGAEHIVNYTSESIVDKVLELTGGKGVQGIYDGVGKDTWEGGCCRRHR